MKKKNFNNSEKKFNYDIKYWANLLVDQIYFMDERTVNDFMDNPDDYLPGKNQKYYNEIISLTITKLKYTDVDKKVESKLASLIKR